MQAHTQATVAPEDTTMHGATLRADDVLADDQNYREFQGVTVRKGTVAAFLANARVWCDPAASEAQRAAAQGLMRDALPALRALGLFDVLQVRDAALQSWLARQ